MKPSLFLSVLAFSLNFFFGFSSESQFFSGNTDPGASDFELIFLGELFRHGSRTPLTNFMNDSWVNKLGMGTLTATGMREQFVLGQQLRERYKDFLPQKYKSNAMYVYSSPENRTIESAMAQLYGMFYEVGPQLPEGYTKDTKYTFPPINITVPLPMFSDSSSALPFNFTAIAYHSNDQDKDLILESQPNCPAINKEVQDSMSSSEYKNLQKELYEILDGYANAFNFYEYYDTDNITIDQAHTLIDYVNCQLWNAQSPNVEFPSSLYTQGQYVLALNQYYPFKDLYRSNVYATKIFEFFLDYMDQKVQDPESPMKLAMLSGHDTNIANVMSSFNLTNYDCIYQYFKDKKPFDRDCIGVPPLASTLFFELYKGNATGEFYVKFRVNDDYFLICDNDKVVGDYYCPWEDVRSLLNSSIIADFDDVCHDYIYEYKMTGVKPYKMAVGIAVILEITTILGIVVVIAKWCKYRRENSSKLLE